MPAVDEHCVITGCIARKLVPKPTFVGAHRNDEQKYELSIDYAKIMAKRLKGQPLQTEHLDGLGSIGEIIHSWVNDKNEWWIKATIDQSKLAGCDMIRSMLGGESPWGEPVCELSLSHAGLKPFEVSMVLKGAREGSTIDYVELVDDQKLAEIKGQTYICSEPEIPSDFPSDTPCIKASFNPAMSNSYTMVRNPSSEVTYASGSNMPDETQPFVKQMNAMQQQQQQLMKQGNFTPQQQQQQQNLTPEAERANLLKKLQEIDAKHPPQQQQQQQQQQQNNNQPQDQNFNRLMERISKPGVAGDPNNTGGIHSLYGNPADDPNNPIHHIERLAGYFENNPRNIRSREEMQGGKESIISMAQSTKLLMDQMAKKDQDLQNLIREKQELESKVQLHAQNEKQQRLQTAAMLKKAVLAFGKVANQSEQKDVDSFENDYVEGKPDAMMRLGPALIRASALADQIENMSDSSSNSFMSDQPSSAGNGLAQTIRQILNPPAQRINASAGGRKRDYEEMHSTPQHPTSSGSSSSAMWSTRAKFIDPTMAQQMAAMEAEGYSDTITLGQFKASKK